MQAQAAPAGEQAWWAGLAALLANVGAYYGQFAPATKAALTDRLAPLEKQLQARAGQLPAISGPCSVLYPLVQLFWWWQTCT